MGNIKTTAASATESTGPTKKKSSSVHVRCSPGLMRELRNFDDFGSPSEVLKRAFAEAKTARTPLFQEVR